MTDKLIAELAREAGFAINTLGWTYTQGVLNEHLTKFAALVAAHEQKKWEDQTAIEINEARIEERERCAKLCDEAAIPRTGEMQTDAQWAALCLATSIRALKD